MKSWRRCVLFAALITLEANQYTDEEAVWAWQTCRVVPYCLLTLYHVEVSTRLQEPEDLDAWNDRAQRTAST